MTCGKCPEGRRIAEGSTFCVLYGIYIRNEHICTRDGGNRHESDGDHSTDGEGKAELQEDSCGAAGGVPVVLSESGERAGISGVETKEEWT